MTRLRDSRSCGQTGRAPTTTTSGSAPGPTSPTTFNEAVVSADHAQRRLGATQQLA